MVPMRNWWQSIRYKTEQIKGSGINLPKDLFFAVLLLVVCVASFGLGRLSVLEDAQTPATLLQAPGADIQPIYLGGEVVASKNGTKYHFPWCAGARAMSEKNRVWFKSIEDAQKAGYAPAGNCKGLK